MRFSVDIKFSRLVHDHVPEQNSTAPLRDIAWKVTPAYPIGLPFAFKAWFDKYVWLYNIAYIWSYSQTWLRDGNFLGSRIPISGIWDRDFLF